MPFVIDPPESAPLPAPAEDASNLWELVYEEMGYRRGDDPATGYQLRKLCEALCLPYQPIYDLLRERDDRPGWSILLDPDECLEKWLRYLARYVGVIPVPEMSEEQLRAEIKAPTGWRRGQADTIRIATHRTLRSVEGEELLVIIRPRTPEVGHHYVRTLLSQTPDVERTRAVVRENIPAWEMIDYDAIEGVSWADIEASFADWEEIETLFSSWEEIEELLPTELPEP